MTILLPLLGALIPILLPLFPGLNQMFAALPRSFFEIIVKIKGGTIAWAPTPQAQREALKIEQAVLYNKIYSGTATDADRQALAASQQREAELGGTIMDFIMSLIGGGGGGSLMPILLIVGLVVALPMITGGGGCGGGTGGCGKKPDPAPKATEVNPTPGPTPAPTK